MKFKDYDELIKTMLRKVVIHDEDGNEKEIEINPEDGKIFPKIDFNRIKAGRWDIIYSIKVEAVGVEEINQMLEQVLVKNLKKISDENIKLVKNCFERVTDYCWKAEWGLENIDYLVPRWPDKDKDKE